MVKLPPVKCFFIKRHQHADEGLTVADHKRLGDQRVAAQTVLQRARGNIFTTGGDDEVFLATGDRDVPTVEHFA